MTITEHRITTGTAPADPAVLDTAASLAAAAGHLTTQVGQLTSGHRRRVEKLAAQLTAVSRLLAKGAGRPDGAPLAAAAALARRAEHAAELPATDSAIARARAVARQAHRWRGHTHSVPAT